MSGTVSQDARSAQVIEPPVDLTEMFELGRFLENHTMPAVLLGPDGEQIPLPMQAYEVLRQVVRAMERGASVSIEPIDRQLTTQQAAEAFRERKRVERRGRLDELTRQGTEDGLYDTEADSYRDALTQARKL